uniref:phospholipase A2 n=1 Tax=Steinernema glaseri TaxID=37863 RepID=A0A1I7XWZ9_9BILA
MEREIDDNYNGITDEVMDLFSVTDDVHTPPPSPTVLRDSAKPGLFSLAQVSVKLGELWTTAREKVFGEDYWIPSDVYEVVLFPPDLLEAHRVVYPPINGKSPASLRVVQGSMKNEPGTLVHHVVYTYTLEEETKSLSVFRSDDMSHAIDFCRRCVECRVLLKLIDKRKDVKRQIRDMTTQFALHPLWRMVHIAIVCNRVDVFSEDGISVIKKYGLSLSELINMPSSPEGCYPLMLAIELNQPTIVKSLLKLGADPSARDMSGNNAMHYAALSSVQMIEIIWESTHSKELLNSLNDAGYSPTVLAIRNANPRCLTTLLGFGAELSIRGAGKNALFEVMQSKGKGIEVLKPLLEASPNLLNERDTATGNTVLHSALFKSSLAALLYLKSDELDLNAKNDAGQTALHIYTHRGDIGMIMTLSSYKCDLNATNSNGNTALHIAVSNKYLEVTRLLLCLGADPNVINGHGDSPRHLASRLQVWDLLKSLVICGAKRCLAGKVGCVSGCVNERALRLLEQSSSTSMTSPDQLASPRSFASIEQLEKEDTNTNERSSHPLQDFQQNIIYDQMIERFEQLIKRKEDNKNIINLLSLDGGGIRGLVIIQMLVYVEKILGEPIIDYFDWCAGTSTGALIAAALSSGRDLRDCQFIYLKFKDLIFDGWTRPYNSNVLEQFIQKELGETTTMADLKWPRIMISTVRADCFPVRLEFIRNYRLPLSDAENDQLGYTEPSFIHVWKALRRSSAAPTYFSSSENYIDGGIISNNPTLDLLSEVQLWNETNIYLSQERQVEIGCVLSVGTGAIPTIPLDPMNLELSTNIYATAVAIKNLGVILVDQVTATEGAPVDRARGWCNMNKVPFVRLSAPLFKDIAMDTKDDNDLAKMMWNCVEYTYHSQEKIHKLCKLLKKVGPSWRRRDLFVSSKGTTHDMETQTSVPTTPD